MIAYFFKGRGLRLAFSIIAVALAVLLMFMTPQIVRITVDSVIGSVPFALPDFLVSYINGLGGREYLRENIYICALAVAAIAALAAVFNVIRRYFVMEPGEKAVLELRERLYDHIQRLPYEYHAKIQTGDIVQRCTSDVETIRSFISTQLSEMVRVVFLAAISVALMLSMDVFMTVVTLSLLPVIVVTSMIFFHKIGRRFLKADEAEGALQTMVQENLTGARVVRAFGTGKQELDRFNVKNDEYTSLGVKLGNSLSIYWSMEDIISGVQMSLVLLLGVVRCVDGQMTLGVFLTFMTYAGMLIWPVRALGRMISDLSKAGVSAGRICEVLSEPIEEDGEYDLTPEISGEIEFKNVTFSFGDAVVLRNLSFKIPAGSTLGILGATGSGKSLIAHLLCRLYELQSGGGQILIDGMDIKRIRRDWLRSKIGLVLQEPFLYSKTIRDNIAAGFRGEELEKIREYAQIAAVDNAIIAFSEGYDTIVGERGMTLSGGQKQRIAIARTLMKETPILILDDAMSAVDTETEAWIRAAFNEKRLKKPVTSIIISHRITTLKQADIIMVLRGGEIEEMGSHEELLELGGAYSRICGLQGDAYSDDS